MTIVKLKKQKPKKVAKIRKLKFENYKSCLEATQLDSKIKYSEKNRINIDNIDNIKKHEEFMRNNKSI